MKEIEPASYIWEVLKGIVLAYIVNYVFNRVFAKQLHKELNKDSLYIPEYNDPDLHEKILIPKHDGTN